MKALKIDESLNDLVMENGTFVWIEGKEEVVQEIRSVLKTVLGDWFLNPEFGTDYFAVLGEKYDREIAIQIIYEAIDQVERVDEVESIDIKYDNRERILDIHYVVIVDGEQIEGSEII